MKFTILGQGTALPPHSIGRDESLKYAADYFADSDLERRKLKALYRLVGVKRRHSVLLKAPEGEGDMAQRIIMPVPTEENPWGPAIGTRMEEYENHAAPLAIESSAQALKNSGVDAGDITHLITVSCTGFSAPGWDFCLIQELGLAPTVLRTNVGFMGCHASLNALRVAQGFAESDPKAVILLCSTELCSLHYHYGDDTEQLVTNALFADGSAAIVGMGRESANGRAWQIKGTGSCLIPDSADGMSWRIRDHGFVIGLSARVPDLIGTHLQAWMDEWLGKFELTRDDIKSWAIHPGGPRILSSAAKALEVDMEDLEDSREIFRNHGNMSSPTILFIIDQMRRKDASLPCVALAFGPGLVAEAVLFA